MTEINVTDSTEHKPLEPILTYSDFLQCLWWRDDFRGITGRTHKDISKPCGYLIKAHICTFVIERINHEQCFKYTFYSKNGPIYSNNLNQLLYVIYSEHYLPLRQFIDTKIHNNKTCISQNLVLADLSSILTFTDFKSRQQWCECFEDIVGPSADSEYFAKGWIYQTPHKNILIEDATDPQTPEDKQYILLLDGHEYPSSSLEDLEYIGYYAGYLPRQDNLSKIINPIPNFETEEIPF